MGFHALPTSEGTYWIYRGIVRFERPNSKSVETKVRWKMQVRQVLRRPDLIAIVINGFPGDLDWSEGTATPQDSLIIQTRDKKLYWIEAGAFPTVFKRLVNPNDDLEGLLKNEDLFLELPLHRGQKFCDAEAKLRSDGMYCRVVESVHSTSFGTVKGVPLDQHEVFTLSYRTNPDDSEVDFVPGLGITSYSYHHHGTVADTEVKLSEFHRGNPE